MKKNALKKEEESFTRGTRELSAIKQSRKKNSVDEALRVDFKQKPESKVYFTDLEEVHRQLE